jgi:chloride channel 7
LMAVLSLVQGLFIPCLLSGATVGRFYGQVLKATLFPHIDPGIYALLGAASMLGGMARIIVSAAVILTESAEGINTLATRHVFLLMLILNI